MSSLMEMSLDDIIKKMKRENVRFQRPYQYFPKTYKLFPPNKVPITDARNKIIMKSRTQIRDAREKLVERAKQKEARLKLEKLRQHKDEMRPVERNVMNTQGIKQSISPNKDREFADISRQAVASQPLAVSKELPTPLILTKGFTANRSIQYKGNMPLRPIAKTVEKDIEIIDDPIEEEYALKKPNPFNRKVNFQLKIVVYNNDTQTSRSITNHRTAITDEEKSPPRPPSILKKRPMAALATDNKAQNADKSEYRIIVSNLRNTVTGIDIQELFGDVGDMLESRFVHPGTAEVIYKTQEAAQRAVILYHNRQLDGLPINCLLVAPRSSTTTSKSGTTPLYSTNSNVEPDISTFHKVLFPNL